MLRKWLQCPEFVLFDKHQIIRFNSIRFSIIKFLSRQSMRWWFESTRPVPLYSNLPILLYYYNHKSQATQLEQVTTQLFASNLFKISSFNHSLQDLQVKMHIVALLTLLSRIWRVYYLGYLTIFKTWNKMKYVKPITQNLRDNHNQKETLKP